MSTLTPIKGKGLSHPRLHTSGHMCRGLRSPGDPAAPSARLLASLLTTHFPSTAVARTLPSVGLTTHVLSQNGRFWSWRGRRGSPVPALMGQLNGGPSTAAPQFCCPTPSLQEAAFSHFQVCIPIFRKPLLASVRPQGWHRATTLNQNQPPGAVRQWLKTFLVVTVGDVLLSEHPTVHRTVPITKNYLASNARSAGLRNDGAKSRSLQSESRLLGHFLSAATCHLCDLGKAVRHIL